MAVYVVLLRAINVGGTGILSMKDLSELCTAAGLRKVRTYIQSGNVIATSNLTEEKLRRTLEDALMKKMGKRVDVIVRSASELNSVLKANPFPEADSAKVSVFFLTEAPASGLLENIVAPGGERLHQGEREIYVHYPDGMGKSKLKLPRFEGPSTARNMNTVKRLVEMTID
jgi:uncharacterized protein (DUF1697 family)